MIEFLLNNIERYHDIGKYLLNGAVHAIGFLCLFWVYIIISFFIMLLLNFTALQLTISIIIFSLFNLIISILYLRKII